MSQDFVSNICNIDATSYDSFISYNKREYKKTVTKEFIETFQDIIILYPQILKTALMDIKNSKNNLKITEIKDMHESNAPGGININPSNKLRITFIIDLQFTKEKISFVLDEIKILDSVKIARLENVIENLSKRLEDAESKINYEYKKPNNYEYKKLDNINLDPNYNFYPGLDSHGYDITRHPNKSIKELT